MHAVFGNMQNRHALIGDQRDKSSVMVRAIRIAA